MSKSTFLILLMLTWGCAKTQSSDSTVVVPEPKFKMTSLKTDTSDFTPAAWEKEKKEGSEWSKMVYSVIENEEPSILELDSAKDVETFCPNYKNLNEPQRLNFWGHFFASLAKPESGWNPLSRFPETSFKYLDSITHLPVVSEGLLQLSYQDEKSHRLDCGFNWSIDSQLNVKDPRRSILDPYLNLRCGIKIFSLQLKKYHSIQLETGKLYWSVLGAKSKSFLKIKRMTQSFKLCQQSI